MANQWSAPTFDQPPQLPMCEGLLDGTDLMSAAFQSWQRPFSAMSAGVPANQFSEPRFRLQS